MSFFIDWLLGLEGETLALLFTAKMVSELLASLLALVCIVALIWPLPLLRTRRRALAIMAVPLLWASSTLWIFEAASAVQWALDTVSAIFNAATAPDIGPPPPDPPVSPVLE